MILVLLDFQGCVRPPFIEGRRADFQVGVGGHWIVRVILFTKYPRLGASSRLRSLQYLPLLKANGVDIVVCPLFDEDYLNSLYSGKGRSVSSIARRYALRLHQLRSCSGADLLWVEKEALPYLPFWVEHAVMPSGVPYVVDYDDAVFHNYDLSTRSWVRRILGRKIDRVMSNAATVVCGNNYLAERARLAGAEKVEYLPTVVDSGRYSVRAQDGRDQASAPVIGWVGSPSTQHYVLELKSVLETLHRKRGARLVLVGAQPELMSAFGDMPVEIVPWLEDTEAEVIAGFDIGIMPLSDGPWERGKCGYKLIQYMASGKPVVASAVGVNIEIVNRWQCGELADSLSNWEQALDKLLADPERRRAQGQRGRLAVEEHYSLQAQGPKLIDILRHAANRS